MTHVLLTDIQWFSRAVHYNRRWKHVQKLRAHLPYFLEKIK